MAFYLKTVAVVSHDMNVGEVQRDNMPLFYGISPRWFLFSFSAMDSHL